jgi:cytochrome bd-type quinol oxidase subunit 2
VPNPLTRTLRAYAADARAAFSAAPVEVALGVALAVTLSIHVRNKGFTEQEFARVAASVALAFPLVFALSVLRARGVVSAAARWAGTAAVLAGCAAFGLWGLHDERAADWWRWVLLAAAAVLLLVMTPSLPSRERDRRASWAFAYRLVVRIVGVGLYSVALFGVLAGAVGAVVSLFDLHRPQHLYADLAGAVFFAFAPWILVGGIHRLYAPAEGGVPLAVSRLGRWLYAPVLVIYLLILYAYAVKVVGTGELPRNLVSPLVIAAGLIGLIGAVLLEPVHGDEEHRGVSLLARAVPALMLPLVPLAAWALLARLDAYGWTEFRYARVAVVAAIGILAVLGTIRLIRRRPPLLTSVPAVLAAALLLSAVGPWSAPAVSRRDQTARLRDAYRQARIDPRRPPRDTVTVDSAVYQRITSGARYLADAHGMGALRAVVPWLPDSTRTSWEVGRMLAIRGGCRPGQLVSSYLAWEGGVPGVMGGTVREVVLMEGDEPAAGAGARLWLRNDTVLVSGGGWGGGGAHGAPAAGDGAARGGLRARLADGHGQPCSP